MADPAAPPAGWSGRGGDLADVDALGVLVVPAGAAITVVCTGTMSIVMRRLLPANS